MKPGTELPWSVVGREIHGLYVGEAVAAVEYAPGFETALVNARYIVHACNMYPRLVEALRGLEETASDEWTDSWVWFEQARALLTECEE